jgi:hypothetical protein
MSGGVRPGSVDGGNARSLIAAAGGVG